MFWKLEKSFFDSCTEHAQLIVGAAQTLDDLFCGRTDSREAAKKVKNPEHSADSIVHAVSRQLRITFLPPIDSDDALELIKTLDDVIDKIHGVANATVEIYGFDPHFAPPPAKTMSRIICEIAELLVTLCSLLANVKKEAAAIEECCKALKTLESKGDEIRTQALRALFHHFSGDFKTYLAWREIFDHFEEATDSAEDCADIAEQLTLKYA